MDAAVSVVSRLGYRNTTLTAIAQEAGLSKGLLWHYFADGDDLMEQTARHTLAELRETVGRDIDLTVPIPQVIRAALARAAALRFTHGAEIRAIGEISLNLRRPDGSQRVGADAYDETYELQAALFQRGVEEGSLRPIDTHHFAVIYQGAVDAMMVYLDRHPGTDHAAYAATVADILLDGVAARSQA